MDRRSKVVTLLAFLITLLFALNLQSHLPQNSDFVGYWAAAKLFLEGRNPYDPTLLMNLQVGVGTSFTSPMMIWNPPVIFTLIWPLGLLDLEAAKNLWTIINVFFIFISLKCLRSTYSQSNTTDFVAWFSLLCFQPIHEVFRLGQLSLMLIASFLLALLCFSKNRRFLGGMILAFQLIKPHLVFLVFLAILFDTYRNKNLKIINGFAFGLISLLSLVLYKSPDIFSQWLNISGGVVDWKSATWTTLLRTELSEPGTIISWPLYVVPLTGVLAYVIFEKLKQNVPFIEKLQIALLLSVIFSPYGWFFDFVMLLPIQVYCATTAVALNNRSPRLILLLSLITINFGTEFVAIFFPYQHHFFWYPTVLGFLYVLTKRFERNARKLSRS